MRELLSSRDNLYIQQTVKKQILLLCLLTKSRTTHTDKCSMSEAVENR